MLNLNKGRPIAKVIGGEYNGIIIYIDNDIDKNDITIEKIKSRKSKNNTPFKEFHLDSGYLVPIPNDKEVERLYIAGPSGSGKSTYAAEYISQFLKMFKGRKFYIFSRLNEDDILDKLDPIRIIINNELIRKPIQPKELMKSIVLFDDIDTIPDKQLTENVRKLRDDLLETGRHEEIYTVSTSHQLMNYKQTRTLLNESTSVTFFPQSGSSYHIKRFLREYCGLDKPQIKKILGLPSRWITISKTFPMYVLYSTGCFLLSQN
jgi:hypothetical protein